MHTKYYENKKIKSRLNYNRNKDLHGVQEFWYENTYLESDSRLECKLNYKNGKQHGLQEYWNYYGQQLYKINYISVASSETQGEQHGLQEYWNPNGEQLYKSNYVNDQLHGKKQSWCSEYDDPHVIKIEYYKGMSEEEYEQYLNYIKQGKICVERMILKVFLVR